jgi:anaerobic dimethyl sulfoxide reductase subunit B (iron-sulfur subunit)
MDVCPVEAVSKDDNGIVLVDRTACLGRDSCGLCLEACPYDVPQFGAEDDIGMEKCDFCYDRLAEGKKPICVESCPMHALDVGYMGEITARYGKFGEVEGFTYIRPCAPSIVINPKKKVTR